MVLRERSALFGHRTVGFDYLRLVLAFSVVAWHSFGLLRGREAIEVALQNVYVSVPVYLILPMFFALSGYLVTGSLERSNSVQGYLLARGLRLFPALMVEVLIAALILGPLVTSLSVQAYLSDPGFFKYFLNIVGLVRYELPGVFLGNPYPQAVNGSLWTVPFELECYIDLMLLYLLGVFRSRWLVLAAFVLLSVMMIGMGFTSAKGLVAAFKDLVIGASGVQANLQEATNSSIQIARTLVASFFAGALIHSWADRLPFNGWLAAVCGVSGVLLLSSATTYFYAPLPLAYLTVWLGLLSPPRNLLTNGGDYSYGVYLYSFPIQQTLAWTGFYSSYWAFFASAVLCSLAIAVLSWHLIEKPCLRLRARIERRRPRQDGGKLAPAVPCHGK